MGSALQNDYTIEGLELRSFVHLTPKESEMVLHWRNHPQTRCYMYNNSPLSEAEHEHFMRSLHHTLIKGYWLVYREGVALGTLSLTRFSHEHHHAYLGIYIDPLKRSQGHGKALMQALIALAFTHLGLHSLRLEVLEENQSAIALYQSLGFAIEGRLRDYVWRGIKEGYRSVIVMSLIKENR